MKRIRTVVKVLIILGVISGLIVLFWNGIFNWGWKFPFSDKVLTATYSNIDDLHALDQYIVDETRDKAVDKDDLLKSYCYKVNIQDSELCIYAFDFVNEKQAMSYYEQYYWRINRRRRDGNIAHVKIGITKCSYCVINDASVLIIETKDYPTLKQFIENYKEIFNIDVRDKIEALFKTVLDNSYKIEKTVYAGRR